MEPNRIIYGAWAVLLLGAVSIAAYNLKPAGRELATSEVGLPSDFSVYSDPPAPSAKVEPTEFLQDGAPGRLPVVSDSDPLADAKLKALHRIVKEEMPGASDDEIKIWTNEFKDLPEDAIRFLLKQKRQSDGPSKFVEAPAPAELLPAETPTSTFTDTVSRARNILIGNLLNAESTGYRSQIVEFASQSEPNGHSIQIAEVRISTTPGILRQTDQPFDFALQQGFFTVTEEDQTYYTRAGRFSLNAQRRLVLRIGEREMMLAGVAAIPESATRISVSESGEVSAEIEREEDTSLGKLKIARFLDPSRLSNVDGCLLQESAASGPAQFASAVVVKQGFLEESNVNQDEQQIVLNKLETWIHANREQTSDVTAVR